MVKRTFNLDNGWYIAKDEHNTGRAEEWHTAIRQEAVPAHIPSIIQQFFPEYHGLAYYWCDFTPDIDLYDGGRVLLCFGGVDYKADVWFNGTYIGCDEGGETPFTFDITENLYLGNKNLLAVRVLNPCEKTIDGLNLMNTPHRNKVVKKSAGSCLNHGGIWYGVSITAVPSVYIDDVYVNADFNTGKATFKVSVKSNADTDAKLIVNVSEKSVSAPAVAEEEIYICAASGSSEATLTLTVNDFKPWHVDTPNLYNATVSVISEGGEHVKTTRFGFREFCVKDGYFYLNGKKLLIKSSHSGNAFPEGQMLPVDQSQLRRDFIYAKSCGFNMIRCIAGLFRPEQMELADEIGLMIYDECFASWCLGYSMWQPWADGEEFKKLGELYPDMPLGDEEAMLKRWTSATEKMIVRDRNHPSVVIFGLLNETKNNSVYRTARDFLPRLRELDNSRLVLLSSGRWDYDFNVGSASNPHSLVWENTWGIDGRPELFEEHIKKGDIPERIQPDSHYYTSFPFSQSDKNVYRSFGNSTRPVFASEFGHGSVFNVIDEVRGFKQLGLRNDLEDYTWLEYQAKSFERDFERLGMKKTFAFPEHVLRESQKNSAMARREIFDVLRSNPRICGYSLTGLMDHGWCGEGLWSYWRQWKPEMFDTISDGWANLRFCLFASHNVYVGEPITVEAVLANDGVLKSGKYTAKFAITKNCAPVYYFSETFELDEKELAVPILKRTLDIELAAGDYELCAELDCGAARANKLPFSIKERPTYIEDCCEVSVIGVKNEAIRLMEEFGIKASEYKDNVTPKILIVGSGSSADVAKAINAAERGSRVLFLEWRTLEPEESLAHVRRVIPDAELCIYWDWLYHKEIVLNESAVFEGLGRGLAIGRDFTKEWTKCSLKTDTTPDFPIAPAFETGSHKVDGSYYLVHVMAGYNFGKGRVFFNTFEIANNIGLPTADRLIINTVRYLDKLN